MFKSYINKCVYFGTALSGKDALKILEIVQSGVMVHIYFIAIQSEVDTRFITRSIIEIYEILSYFNYCGKNTLL